VIDGQMEKARQRSAERQGIPPDEVDMISIEAFYVLSGSYIDGALERTVEEYGSMEAYIRDGLGVTDEEVQILRDQLLE
jgi:protein-tyrosine phosphatase